MARTKTKRTGTILVVALASMLLTVTAAFAQYPPAEDFDVTCTPEVVTPGDDLSCGVVGAVPGETLFITAEYNPVFFEDTEVADENGEADFAVSVPDDADDGITVTVTGEESGEAATDEVALEDEATPPSDPSDPSDPGATAPTDPSDPGASAPIGDDLPRTGMESSTLIAAGAVLLLLGAVTVLVARRRDRGRVEA